MFGEDKIHEELHKYSQKDEEEQLHSWNILGKRKFKQEDELSQWNTTSYRAIPKIKKKTPFSLDSPTHRRINQSFGRENHEGPLLPEQLTHRYTFLNQHSRNQRHEELEEMLIKSPKNIELKLPKNLKNSRLPTIHQEAHYKLMQTRSKSFIDSKSSNNASIYFIRHHNQIKSRMLSNSKSKFLVDGIESLEMTQSLAEIKSMRRARAEKLTVKKKQKQGKSKQAKSKSPIKANSPNAVGLKNCLIFSSKRR